MMKMLACLTLAACSLVGPVTGFAQSPSGSLTRAQVRAELARLEQAGYRPSAGDQANYPADIQAAEEKIAAEGAQRPATVTAGGAVSSGSTPVDGSRTP